jgi:Sec-independent protein secretion pathway component TatC
MTIGEHLDELRGCVVRSLVALVLACLICIWPSRYLLEWLARPLVLVLRRYGQPDNFLATSPAENFLVYVKVVVIFGVILAAPYIIAQLWSFVATGLYPREKRWIHRLVPLSVGLFITGILFMYGFVLIVSLNFLVGFSTWLPLPDPTPNFYERHMLGTRVAELPASQPTPGQALVVALLDQDPPQPPIGSVWVNVQEQKLKVRAPSETFSTQLLRDDRRAMVTTHFRIGEYLSFLLTMTVAFGAAFQMPLVVAFLGRTGLVPARTLRKYRRVVILVIAVIAGVLAPPDLFSMLLLSVPMVALFEVGLLFTGRKPSGAPAPPIARDDR